MIMKFKFILGILMLVALVSLTSMDTAEKVSNVNTEEAIYEGCTTWYVESFTDPVHGGTYDVYQTHCSCGEDEPCTPYSYYSIFLTPQP